MERRIIDYDPSEMKIVNTPSLRASRGARLLLVIDSPYPGEYIAKRWLRKMPATTSRIESVIRF